MNKSEAIEKLNQYICAVKKLPDSACILSISISMFQGKESNHIHLFSENEVPETYTEERIEIEGDIARYTDIGGVAVKWYVSSGGNG